MIYEVSIGFFPLRVQWRCLNIIYFVSIADMSQSYSHSVLSKQFCREPNIWTMNARFWLMNWTKSISHRPLSLLNCLKSEYIDTLPKMIVVFKCLTTVTWTLNSEKKSDDSNHKRANHNNDNNYLTTMNYVLASLWNQSNVKLFAIFSWFLWTFQIESCEKN